ncbi:uncharacterized protein A4U43_C07F34040 [Asparagus officinalis]|uniref:CP-type G domain-containing protein n=1 Tax=Asparagus officinalis TaxID=4686 RepID=A0A5P1EGV6_ASPOF|nr:uncharacterized protein A4U43_C07F34040 [Asparagus officinalis]
MGGNKEKSQGLGRSLIRHHNQLVQQSKDRGKALRQQRRILESITDVTDIDAVIEQAEEADRVYTVDNPDPNLLVNLDLDGVLSVEERREEQREEEALHAGSLRVPRRPPWNASMSLEEFDANERQEFLVWRRNLAKLEENDKLVLTPFEKNLDIWRQLWRVLERSDLLVMVVDARDPLFYRCPDLEAYAQEIDEQKKTLLLVNKADLLPFTVSDCEELGFSNFGEKPSIERALDDLESFDLAGGVLVKTGVGAKKKNVTASYKHHKKPQRKKDRSWRVGNDNGEGMPVLRVFQKPAVSFDAVRAAAN